MKNLLRLSKLTFLLFIGFSIQSCSDDDDNVTTPTGLLNIVEIATDNPELSNLVAALSVADGNLVDVLSGGEFTVLAPTNEAFETFLTANGFMSLSEVPTDILSNILLNHVVTGTVTYTNLVDAGSGYSNTNATNAGGDNLSLYFDTSSGVIFNGVSSVTGPDIEASNGIIHVVDEVIGLPTIATFATTNDALSTLVSALSYADTGSPTVPWIATVSDASAGPFTVFAPVNDAFLNPNTGILAELNLSGFGEGAGQLNAATTDAVLLMHVVGGNIQSSGLPNGAVSTIGGGVIQADNTAFTLTDPSDRVSNIVTSLVDIQATNGVVHVIDRVLLP